MTPRANLNKPLVFCSISITPLLHHKGLQSVVYNILIPCFLPNAIQGWSAQGCHTVVKRITSCPMFHAKSHGPQACDACCEGVDGKRTQAARLGACLCKPWLPWAYCMAKVVFSTQLTSPQHLGLPKLGCTQTQ